MDTFTLGDVFTRIRGLGQTLLVTFRAQQLFFLSGLFFLVQEVEPFWQSSGHTTRTVFFITQRFLDQTMVHLRTFLILTYISILLRWVEPRPSQLPKYGNMGN
ncbi:hypothetical protein D3C73_923840 [compost metagenome]